MLRIVIDIDAEVDTAQGVEEKLAMDLERFGDVRVVEVREIKPEQMRMAGG